MSAFSQLPPQDQALAQKRFGRCVQPEVDLSISNSTQNLKVKRELSISATRSATRPPICCLPVKMREKRSICISPIASQDEQSLGWMSRDIARHQSGLSQNETLPDALLVGSKGLVATPAAIVGHPEPRLKISVQFLFLVYASKGHRSGGFRGAGLFHPPAGEQATSSPQPTCIGYRLLMSHRRTQM